MVNVPGHSLERGRVQLYEDRQGYRKNWIADSVSELKYSAQASRTAEQWTGIYRIILQDFRI
jgi:hypothetical protein